MNLKDLARLAVEMHLGGQDSVGDMAQLGRAILDCSEMRHQAEALEVVSKAVMSEDKEMRGFALEALTCGLLKAVSLERLRNKLEDLKANLEDSRGH